MFVCIILMAVGAVSLTLYLIEKIKFYSLKATMIKAMTSLLFIALAVYCNFTNSNRSFGAFIIIGLAFGLLGDIWLGLKYAFKEQARNFLFAGFACFAIGHAIYILGIMSSLDYLREWYAYAIPFGAGLLFGFLILLLEKPMHFNYGEFKSACFIYGVLLFSTVFTTFFLAVSHGFMVLPYNLLFVGGTLFSVSDLILCGTYFGGKNQPIFLISNAITYYVAQYLIAFSLFFL